MIEYRYLLFQITSKYWRIGLSKVGRKENSEIAGGWDCIIWISDRGEVIKGRDRRTREPKRRRGEGGGLYCNGPGYKTAGCKAGRAVVKQLERAGPPRFAIPSAGYTFFLGLSRGISRAAWPKWSSNARSARLLSPSEAALAPSRTRGIVRPSIVPLLLEPFAK